MYQSPSDSYELREAFDNERVHLAPLDSDCLSGPGRVSKDWHIQGRQGPVTGRSTPSVLARFLLRPSQFRGKKLLDVGCGLTALHADLASIGFPPAYSAVVDGCSDVIAWQNRVNPEAHAHQSLGTELPFKNAIFDIVISNFCMPSWAHSPGEIRDFFRETRRVLRRGGILAVNPMIVYTKTDEQTARGMELVIENQLQAFSDPVLWQRVDVAQQYADSLTVVAVKQ